MSASRRVLLLAVLFLFGGLLSACGGANIPLGTPEVAGIHTSLVTKDFSLTIDSITPTQKNGNRYIMDCTIIFVGTGPMDTHGFPNLSENISSLKTWWSATDYPVPISRGYTVKRQVATKANLAKNDHKFFLIGPDPTPEDGEPQGGVLLGTITLGPNDIN